MASRRQYLTQAELEEFADVTITNVTEGDDQISQAEELIDGYVGYQPKFFEGQIDALATSGTSTTLTLNTDHRDTYNTGYFTGCQIEIVGGTGSGQTRIISSSTKAGVITVSSAWTTTPDATTYYKIHQLGKFPRVEDVMFDSQSGADTYYKSIPEAVKRATASQVQFVIEMGDKYFSTDQTDKQSETIGDYSYTNAVGAVGNNKLIAPKVKNLLRGIVNRRGIIEV